MKHKFLIFLFAGILGSCNNISDKPVSEKLSIDELSRAIKKDTMFSSFYENIRKNIDEMDDIKKAEFNDVTYRRLFKFVKFSQDTVYWNPLIQKWEKEWETDFGLYSLKADSVIDYWKKFLDENSLDNFVKIELVKIDKEYYDYIGDLKEVDLGFKLTPSKGRIEQICFNYGYKAKIDSDNFYKKHNCILTSPFSSPVVKYWEVDYSDKDDFGGKSIETFLRDFDIEIKITAIRKDGENISTDDFHIPKEVSNYLNFGNEEMMKDFYKVEIIKNLIYSDFIEKWKYIIQRADVIREKEDKLCFDFLGELYK